MDWANYATVIAIGRLLDMCMQTSIVVLIIQAGHCKDEIIRKRDEDGGTKKWKCPLVPHSWATDRWDPVCARPAPAVLMVL